MSGGAEAQLEEIEERRLVRHARQPRIVAHQVELAARILRPLKMSATEAQFTHETRPRLAVFRSLGHIYAQIVDDDSGKTLLAVDSRSKDFLGTHKTGGNVAAAKAVGELVGRESRPARPCLQGPRHEE